MYLILSVFSPGVIEIWEGFLTFLFFPITVFTAYIADIKIVQKRFIPHRYRRTSRGLIATEGEEMKMLEENGADLKIAKLTQAHEDKRISTLSGVDEPTFCFLAVSKNLPPNSFRLSILDSWCE
ncbi:unnamed protein product [Gongylonema pulchrum]|uniref:PhoLip_ATPase_C domain-containing protein n=1 Tax=Gongylonema pulchrum TaxID=637853 RepID=A0A183D8Y1_9BILA|nr:unnamed protein product [Gongylonema pulchrum]